MKRALKNIFSKIKEKIISFLCAVDNILDKASRPLMYFLELMGVIIATILMIYLIGGIKMMYSGKIEQGKEIVNSLSIALNSMKELLVGIFVALPAAIGTLKALTKKWKGNGSSNNNEQAN